MRFSALTGVRPMVEVMPLEQAAEGYKLDDGQQGAIPRRAHDGRRVSATRK